MITSIGPAEIIVVLAIALIIFGPKRLPKVGRSIGKGVRELRGSLAAGAEDDAG